MVSLAILETLVLVHALISLLATPDKRFGAFAAVSNPKSCEEVLLNGKRLSGEYTIWIDGVTPTNVSCNMDIDGGGWTVIQRRVDASTDFYRKWTEYKQGFGNLSKNVWLGLDNIHKLTERGAVLRIDMTEIGGKKIFAKYSRCKIGSESTNYKLEVSGYAGNANDSLDYHNGMGFSTYDRDSDPFSGGNCAVYCHGAWWYRVCQWSNLNGAYPLDGRDAPYMMTWWFLRSRYGSIIYSEMKVRVFPQIPTNVATTDLTNTSVRISWQSSDSNLTVWYTIECSTAENGSAACKDILYSPEAKNITSRKADLRKLHPYTNYKFTIYAKNAASRNLSKKYWPNETIAFMTRPGLPSEVGSFLYKVEKKTLTLGWQPPPFKRDAVVYYETKCDGMKIKSTFYPYLTISMGEHTAITCQVRSINSAGKGPWRTKTIILSVLPRKPTNVATTDLTNTSVRITWQSRKSNSTVRYTIECSTAENGLAACKGILYSPEAKNITSRQVDLRKLHPYTNYKFTIYAKNAASRNLPKKYWPNETIAFMTRPGLPSEVGSFLYKVERKTLTLSWQAPPFKRDAVVYYETKCDGMKMKRTFYPYITMSIQKQDAITCEVRATNTAGKGPWRTKTIILSDGLSSLEIGVISMAVVCFIMLIVNVIVWRRSKKRRRWTYKNDDIELKANTVENVGFQDENEEPVYIEIIGDDFEYPFDKLDRKAVLGQGEFGVVYRACASDISGNKGVSQVAVKILKGNARERDQRDFLNELSIMKTIRPHQNVVRLLGCCTLTGRNCIILEYLRHGNLQVFLRKSRGYYGSNECELHTSVLSAHQLLQFCFMIADGMNHISSQNVIHRDLACRNILVGSSNGQYVCKISDLGHALQLNDIDGFYERAVQEKLPVKWMAYESLFQGIFRVKSDVWSFGVALYEIFTVGDTPYPLFKSKEIALQIRNGYRMSKPPHCSVELVRHFNTTEPNNANIVYSEYEIMMKCWNNDANLRPSFSNLKDTFQELLSKANRLFLNMDNYNGDLYVHFESDDEEENTTV